MVTCAEIMRRRVRSVRSGTRLDGVAHEMRTHGVGFLPVCTVSGEVLGVVTDRDLALSMCDSGDPARPVDSVMSRELVWCTQEDGIWRAEELMARGGVHRVVVLDDAGKLAGVVSLTDIAQCEEPIRLARLVRDISAHEFRVESFHGNGSL